MIQGKAAAVILKTVLCMKINCWSMEKWSQTQKQFKIETIYQKILTKFLIWEFYLISILQLFKGAWYAVGGSTVMSHVTSYDQQGFNFVGLFNKAKLKKKIKNSSKSGHIKNFSHSGDGHIVKDTLNC